MNGAILAGGGATRFGGRPKGLERVAGERILDRLVAVMEAALGCLPLLVANAADAPAWRPDLRTVADRRQGIGSLGGIYTAVCEAPAPVVCVAWDMPFVTPGLVAALAEAISGPGAADACLPASGGRRGVEPLCAAYGPACRAAIERQLESADHRAIGFHADVRVRILPADAVARFGNPERIFFNVNSATDLSAAEALWRGSSA